METDLSNNDNNNVNDNQPDAIMQQSKPSRVLFADSPVIIVEDEPYNDDDDDTTNGDDESSSNADSSEAIEKDSDEGSMGEAVAIHDVKHSKPKKKGFFAVRRVSVLLR